MCTFRLSAFADEAASPLNEQLDALAQNHVGMLEMRGVGGKSVMDLTDAEAREAKRALDERGVTVSALGSPIGKIGIEDDFEAHMISLSRAFALCDLLETDRIRMFSFYIPKDVSPDACRDKVFFRMEKMQSAAEKAGITLFHENEKGIFGDTDARCVQLMEAFYPRLRCVFDPANFVQCGVKPGEAFPGMAKYVGYMHIKDALLRDGAVVPCGMGDGSVKEILSALADAKNDMVLTVEPHLTVFDGLNRLQDEKVKHRFAYPDKATAFSAACDALKDILTSLGFSGDEGGKGIWTR